MRPVKTFYQTPTQSAEDTSLPKLLSFLRPKPNGNMLDIGCFDGSKSILFCQVAQCTTVFGVDFLPEQLSIAREHGVETLEADLNSDLPLPFPAQFFDVILCSEVIEHLFSPDDLLDEMARLLKPDGYIILTTPNLASWKNRIALLLGWQPFASEVSTRQRYGNPLASRGRPSGHLRLFTLRALLEMVKASGLQPTQIGGIAALSPQRNLMGILSRLGDRLFTRNPALADRLVLRLEKKP